MAIGVQYRHEYNRQRRLESTTKHRDASFVLMVLAGLIVTACAAPTPSPSSAWPSRLTLSTAVLITAEGLLTTSLKTFKRPNLIWSALWN